MLMDCDDFKIGFWHTFGQHAGEPREDIIKRKTDEIIKNGWTLWSFQFRKTFNAWRHQIEKLGNPPVFVFCSDSEPAPPAKRVASASATIKRTSEPRDCNVYKFNLEDKWATIPREKIRVPHPLPGEFSDEKHPPSAFYVQKVLSPDDVRSLLPSEWISESEGQLRFALPAPEWFSERKGNLWLSKSLQSRGEIMIRPSKTPISLVKGDRATLQGYAVLELKAPYLAYVGVVPPNELL